MQGAVFLTMMITLSHLGSISIRSWLISHGRQSAVHSLCDAVNCHTYLFPSCSHQAYEISSHCGRLHSRMSLCTMWLPVIHYTALPSNFWLTPYVNDRWNLISKFQWASGWDRGSNNSLAILINLKLAAWRAVVNNLSRGHCDKIICRLSAVGRAQVVTYTMLTHYTEVRDICDIQIQDQLTGWQYHAAGEWTADCPPCQKNCWFHHGNASAMFRSLASNIGPQKGLEGVILDQVWMKIWLLLH